MENSAEWKRKSETEQLLERKGCRRLGSLAQILVTTYGDQMIQVGIGRIENPKRSKADVIQCFVIDTVRLIGRFDELVHG